MHEILSILIGIPCTLFVTWMLAIIFWPFLDEFRKWHGSQQRPQQEPQPPQQEPKRQTVPRNLPDNVIPITRRKAS